jgi:glucose-6-phosphate isomerase
MRTALRLMDNGLRSSLPAGWNHEGIFEKVRQWEASQEAGYRRLITKGSDCYTDFSELRALAQKKIAMGLNTMLLLGTGGSSLGAEALIHGLHRPRKSPRFEFADNNDPDWFHLLLSSLDPKQTLVYVVSKSGKTPETISQLLVTKAWLEKALPNSWQEHFVFCSDPKTGDLRELARRCSIPCLTIPSPVGGRYSVLTAAGLFPAAFAGLQLETFISGAHSLLAWEEEKEANPCYRLALQLVSLRQSHPITVMMPYSSQLASFSRWFCQLWAESLGKQGMGLTPYPALGTTDQHSQLQLYAEGPRDKVIGFIDLKKWDQDLPLPNWNEAANLASVRELGDVSMLDLFQAEARGTKAALAQLGVPHFTIEMDCLDEFSLGALFYFWEWTTSFAGACLGVNPFDQPGVERSKELTKTFLRERRK